MLTWKVRDGIWSAVLTNADGSLGRNRCAGWRGVSFSLTLTVLAALTPPPPFTPAGAPARSAEGSRPPGAVSSRCRTEQRRGGAGFAGGFRVP
jgi:hypothetical protein